MVFFVCERQRNQARGCHTYKSAARSLPVMDETARAIPAWIETERLRICPPQPGDGAEINAAIRETYDALHRWMEWANHVPTVEETEENCRQAYGRFVERTDFPFLARLKDSGQFVLRGGLHPGDWKVP